MAGLPGTGKSTLSKTLAAQVSGTVLSKDEVRHAIFSARDVEYSTEQDDFCMEIMLEAAQFILRKDRNRAIILDGRTFSKGYQIQRVLEFADREEQSWRIIECVCSDSTAKARLEKASDHPAGNRDYELYRNVKAHFEKITVAKLVLDTDQPLEKCLSVALSYLVDPRTKSDSPPTQARLC
jgi:predicted kinase